VARRSQYPAAGLCEVDRCRSLISHPHRGTSIDSLVGLYPIASSKLSIIGDYPSQAGALLHPLEAIVLSRANLSLRDFGRAKPSVTQIRCMVAAARASMGGTLARWAALLDVRGRAAERPHQSNLAVPPGHLAAAEIQIDLCPGQNCLW
jgi:hypothetical protein